MDKRSLAHTRTRPLQCLSFHSERSGAGRSPAGRATDEDVPAAGSLVEQAGTSSRNQIKWLQSLP